MILTAVLLLQVATTRTSIHITSLTPSPKE